MGPFPIAGSVSTFLVYYANSPNCKQNVNITLPPTCSACTQTADAGNGGELSCTQMQFSLQVLHHPMGSINGT